MRNAEDIKWIGESSLRKNYDPLYAFFQEVWGRTHDYVVLNGRRCLNLNYIFMRVHADDGKPVPNAGKIITNNALLLYSGKIVRYYLAYKRFPRILIVDDLAVHGRSIANLLSELEELIIPQISPTQEMSKDRCYYIRRAMADAIDVLIFAANRQPLLVSDIYLRKIRVKQSLDMREIRALSQQLSSFLQRVDIPNTSYVLSYPIQKAFVSEGKWMRQPWTYRGAKHCVYLANKPQEIDIKVLPTVRLREPFAQRNCSTVWLTSVTLFGELPIDVLSSICHKVEKWLDPGKFCGLRSILQMEHSLLRKQQAQFLSFLLSAIYLRDFLIGGSMGFLVDKSDLHKIAQNFGKVNDIEPELKRLISTSGLLTQLRTVLQKELNDHAGVLLHKLEHGSGGEDSCKFVNFHLEDVLYNMGMDSEKSAYEAISLNRLLSNDDSGAQPLDALLRWEKPLFHFDFPGIHTTDIQKISCLLALVDSGVMEIGFESKKKGQDRAIYNSVRAKALSTLSIPRRLHLFMPALALIEREGWRCDYSKPKDAVKRFIQYLSTKGLPHKSRAFADARLEEETALAFLKTQGEALAELLYDCGQTFSGWDISLVTSEDWEEEGSGSYLDFVRQEEREQRIYLERAKQFLVQHYL